MNNTEKNTYAKRQVKQATISLLKQNELSDITIGQITELAQVSRNAFYRNYKTKEDIVYDYVSDLLKEWEATYRNQNSDSGINYYKSQFQHFSDHKEFYLLLKQRNLFHLVLRAMIGIFGNPKDLDNISAYSVAYISYGTYGWIDAWIGRGMQESPETIASILASNGMK